MRLDLARSPSPIGTMLVVWDGEGQLRALEFEGCEARLERLLRRHYGRFELAAAGLPSAIAQPLDAYFAGAIEALAAIRVATGGTPFQRRVWAALRAIPPGTTTTYGRLAERLGRAGASRAVGLANGANPIGIVVPCHRVIGASGALTGYAGGLERKRWLLEHERRHADARFPGEPAGGP